ncbi:sterol desaturase family protein [Nioella sediminis]|jgi:sterol desaturase/sphingolipid hydroxylase (fatty acid hydroxylase superfamily)|uniref:sterol desaturase family protein n=1 Tax=Nioella sediminis TaxID=1912092 RepID=UPI0008FD02D6|nr:sterol desaturase family protein [Nioella sediminis]TBX24651.1 desaturase [Roseovarius sp. JS7-11]
MQDNTDQIPGWNHVPDVPIQVSPFFSWPPDPVRMARWIAARWLGIAENVLVLALATISWLWFQPPLEVTATLAPGWIFGLWIRNMALMILVAGSLHWFFYMRKAQGERLKFDPRDLMIKGRQFTFGGQVRDNMFWSLGSGVGFWTAYEVLMFWAMANGYAPLLSPAEHPVIFILWFLLTPVWISFHFYWVHRALHWGPLYQIAHALHHRNVNVGPWSGLSMHPVEHLIFFSSILIHFIVPAHPLHILFHMQHQALTAATSHTGFENLLVEDRKRLALGTFHHQMHHRYFEVNYGNLEMPWDKWFGTFHDGTKAAHERLKSRRGRRA